jgi:hypothetical protein
LDKAKPVNSKTYVIIATIVAAFMLLFVSSCAINRQPAISSLVAEAPGWTAPSGSLGITCNASDLDGDTLSYSWVAEGGDISGTGPQTVWTAPEQVGMYDVTVVVDDGRGGEATASVPLIASNGPPPVIDDIVVSANHTYLKETTTGYKVARDYDYSFQCVASGTGGDLTYEWSCTGGEISGDGSAIIWTAPNLAGTDTVTVKVFDTLGNWVKESVSLEIVPCASCAFG